MGVAAEPQAVQPSLEIMGVLRDTLRLYRTLFARSFLTGFIVFAILGLVEFYPAIGAILAFVGTALVQGALVTVVEAEHRGVRASGFAETYHSSWSRLGSLVGVSLLTGIGIGFGLLLFIVPGVLLAIRWAVAVPIVMLEGLGAREAMRRSQELVRGRRKDVFRVLVNIWVRAGLAWFATGFLVGLIAVGSSHPFLAFWLGGALSSAIVTPYAAHAMNVVYYRLTDPEKPIIAEHPPQTWHSIWHEHDPRGDSSAA